MKFLFYFVHPAKYYFFRQVINRLLAQGHSVKVLIISKDVLEPLVSGEKWEYVNIFPKGRRSSSSHRLHILWSTAINFFKTLWRLHKVIGHREYDLVVTDDLASLTCAYRSIPCIVFTDNELSTVPELRLILHVASRILLPESVVLDAYSRKHIRFKGYKESAYLHPDVFSAQPAVLEKYGLEEGTFFVIRSVAMTASHDRGVRGLCDNRLRVLVRLLAPYGRVLISSERDLAQDLKQYELRVPPHEILDLLYYARLFVGDSGTMSSEAALLGTPSLMFHDFVGRLGVMTEKEIKYRIMFGFNQHQFDQLQDKLTELLMLPNLKTQWREKVALMFDEHGDLNEFLYKTFTHGWSRSS